MKRVIGIGLALGVLVAGGQATAQTVVGEALPEVEVNLRVLESLGAPPSLPSMLMDRPRETVVTTPVAPLAGIDFKPYKPERTIRKVSEARRPKPKAEPAAATAAEPTPPAAPQAASPPSVNPAVNELVKAAQDVAKAGTKPPRPELPETIPAPAKAEPKIAKAAPQPAAPQPAAPQPAAPQPAAPVTPASVPAPAPAPAAPPPPAVAIAAPAAVPPPAPAAPAPVAPPAAVPAPAVAPVPAPAPAAVPAPQQASVSAAVRRNGDTLTMLFARDSAELPEGARAEIEKISRRLEADQGLGLQLMAYAEGGDAEASRARRLSLSRALEVRRLLMEAGIRSTRIEVRALGNKGDGGPADRVDAQYVAR